jgi:hypothetical protein
MEQPEFVTAFEGKLAARSADIAGTANKENFHRTNTRLPAKTL